MKNFEQIFRYSDWANQRLLDCCAPLADARLDQPFDIGCGSLRRTLIHLYNGEHVWLQRWRSRPETPWPDEGEIVGIPALRERFRQTAAERKDFLSSIAEEAMEQLIVYRDSRGAWFQAALADMLMQAGTHSVHHRAQIVNMLRRLGAETPELDFMYWRREPAPAPSCSNASE